MRWEVSSQGTDGAHRTYHYAPGHDLQVGHDTGAPSASHHVYLSSTRQSRDAGMWYPSGMHSDKTLIRDDQGHTSYGPPPSEQLRALIESHHETHAWMPLLDKLAEEYPQLDAAVSAHTAARAQG